MKTLNWQYTKTSCCFESLWSAGEDRKTKAEELLTDSQEVTEVVV